MEKYSVLTKLSSFPECFLKKQTIEKYKSKKKYRRKWKKRMSEE